MSQRYAGVTSRLLEPSERRVPVKELETPLVIEPRQSATLPFLREFLAQHSTQLLEDLARHGALLLRGFDMQSASGLESCLLSIRGMSGMRDILLKEPGRAPIEGSQFVSPTNSLAKTGGTFNFGVFHTENYTLPDVPRYITFWCRQPSTLGGETGVVNVAKICADLPTSLRNRLAERAFLTSLFPVAEVVRRYGLSTEDVLQYCSEAHLPIEVVDGTQYVAIYKPSIIQHPTTKEQSLIVAFGAVAGMSDAIVTSFARDYAGREWLLHRLVWKYQWLTRAQSTLIYRRFNSHFRATGAMEFTAGSSPVANERTLSSAFTSEDIRDIAASMRDHFSSFMWKAGDVFIIDNLKLAHNGMAGHGARDINVMMCNPLRIPTFKGGPGTHVIPDAGPQECLGAEIMRARTPPRTVAAH